MKVTKEMKDYVEFKVRSFVNMQEFQKEQQIEAIKFQSKAFEDVVSKLIFKAAEDIVADNLKNYNLLINFKCKPKIDVSFSWQDKNCLVSYNSYHGFSSRDSYSRFWQDELVSAILLELSLKKSVSSLTEVDSIVNEVINRYTSESNSNPDNKADEPEIVRDLAEDAVNRDIECCPLGGDISDDCADCAYSEDYHFVGGECKEREVK